MPGELFQPQNPADVWPMAKVLASGLVPEYLKENIASPQFPSIPGKMPAVDPMNPLPWMGVDLASMGLGPAAKGAGAMALKAIMAGPLALSADKAMLSKAVDMSVQKINPRDILSLTGWYRGADGKWRFEIPEKDFAVRATPRDDSYSLDQVFKHPGLYEAYPQLKGFEASLRNARNPTGFHRAGTKDDLGGIHVAGPDNRSRLLTGAHEMQHAVQALEDFTPGANYSRIVSNALNKVSSKPVTDVAAVSERAFRDYARHAGEVEARNASSRVRLSPEERLRVPPMTTADISVRGQIVPKDWYKTQTPEIQNYIKLLMGNRSVF